MKKYVRIENGVLEEELCKISLHIIVFPKKYSAPIKLDVIFVSTLC